MTATWRDYLPQFLAEQPNDGSGAVRSVSVVRAVEGGDASTNGPNGPNGTHRDEARVGLARLRDMRTPAGVNPAVWAQVVADAAALAEQGWVAHALGLGWTLLDLFGAVVDPEGDHGAEGLAVWLSGRSIRALSNNFAVVIGDDGSRFYFTRPREAGACLLWEIGRGAGSQRGNG